MDSDSNKEIQTLSMDAIEVLAQCGFNKGLTMYYTILWSKAELDQLLKTLQKEVTVSKPSLLLWECKS